MFETMWGLVNPDSGTHTVSVNFSAAMQVNGRSLSFYGVHQTTALGTPATATNTTGHPSVTVTAEPYDIVIDSASLDIDCNNHWLTAGAEQVCRTQKQTPSNCGCLGASSTQAGAPSVVMSWIASPSDVPWAIVAVALKPAATDPNSAALDFDGSNDYAARPSDDAILDIVGDWTIECWVKHTDYSGGDQVIMSKGGVTWESSVWCLRVAAGQVILSYRNGFASYDLAYTVTTGDHNVADAQWAHWAGTYDAATDVLRIYLNGLLKATSGAMAAAPQANACLACLGAAFNTNEPTTNPSFFFPGSLDEARVWNVRRSDQEIYDSYDVQAVGDETGLVACWRANEGSGGTVEDQTTNALDLTLSGATWETADFPALREPEAEEEPSTAMPVRSLTY
jgi:hypothetical protein